VSVKVGRKDDTPARKHSRVTSFDVARRARVSRTTVSFVLNGIVDSKISEKTKARVLKAARDLAYVPDAAAKALVRRRSENIGLVYTRSYHHMASNSFFLRLMDGLMQFVH
jgi:LacI family transcriptional regulator